MTNTDPRIARILQLIAGGDIDNADDLIMFLAQDRDITREEAEQIMEAVEVNDPTHSGDAAQIRDTLRDNSDHHDI